jgi:hypothetical protein
MTQKEIEDAINRVAAAVKPGMTKEAFEQMQAEYKRASAVVGDFDGIEQLPEAIREANEVRRELTKQLAKKK